MVQANDESNDYFERHVRPILHDRCLSCHSHQAKTTEGGLALDSQNGWVRGGGRGPAIIPHQPEDSLFVRAIRYRDKELQMPPDEQLPDREVEILTKWIEHGAIDPRVGENRVAGMSVDEAKSWWSLQPIPAFAEAAPDNQQRSSLESSMIDRWINSTHRERGISPTGRADARTLSKRLHYDLTGLPPSIEELDAFAADQSPDAYEELVERLLASPRYGERWGRHWLDLMRYADYLNRQTGPNRQGSVVEYYEAWKYRDWVIKSFNDDLPYDRFLHMQIAGDLYPADEQGIPNQDGLIATTWMALGPWDNGDADKHKIVSDIVDDQINVISQSFLGMTVSCARCHDHKFDPITIDDYYAMAGMFYSSCVLHSLGAKGQHTEALRIPIANKDVVEQRHRQLVDIQNLEKQKSELEAKQKELAKATQNPNSSVEQSDANQPMSEIASQLEQLQNQLAAAKANLIPEPPLALAVREGGTPGGLYPGIQDVPVHRRGKYYEPGPIVPRGLPRFLAQGFEHRVENGSGRNVLAQWMASANNPLPARVIVNRIWQWHFGRGLVDTPSNFGKLGSKPSHAELLDYLARQLIDSNWSLKRLHREILLSEAYQRMPCTSKQVPQELRDAILETDAENRWLSHFPSRRLQSEEIRDTLLAVCGELQFVMGGPSDDSLASRRRSVFVQSSRYTKDHFASLFDAADNEQPVATRNISMVSTQALFFRNHPFVTDLSGRLAERVVGVAGSHPETQLEQLVRRTLLRSVTNHESVLMKSWLDGNTDNSTQLIELCRLMLSTNELLFVD